MIRGSGRVVVVGINVLDMKSFVKRIPVVGETCLSTKFEEDFGGKGANQAYQASLLLKESGCPVSFVSKIGNDARGHTMVSHMQKAGVNMDHVSIMEDIYSGCSSLLVDEEGQNVIVVSAGANAYLDESDILKAKDVITDSSVILGQLEAPLEATVAAFELASAQDKKTLKILNTAPIPSKLSADFYRLLDLAHIICPNEIEAEQLTGHSDPTQAADTLLEECPNCDAVVVTLGKDGALLAKRNFKTKIAGVDGIVAKDTVGAGDSFMGALGASLALGDTLLEAVEKANRVAAFSVSNYGTQ
eukprot:CAMPEP_0203755494 /NCGR_PEP_ID=MMETSP0098-20131031/8935_1 /ASSEMBLY_ACC=CAM_ASM_000208 /TAXON_ID=96639 /ORGANISM=" , Strain NY0313808BC1" /LENGTH=301 /DNA_ID=CAMNT_0050646983 /DNA_START=535 /DNA_END=1437 /DNA_ORIENTATION=+